MAYISKKWFDLAKRYAAGTASVEEFADIPKEEALKIRGESEFVRYANVSYKAPQAVAEKFDQTIRYVMVSEHKIGRYGDVPMRDGMNFEKFNERGGPFLYQHGKSPQPLPPLGNVTSVKRGRTPDKKYKAWLGDVKFTPEGENPFNDMIHAAVLNGSMPAGSIAFRPTVSRMPTKQEEKKYDLDGGGIIFEASDVLEFSAVDVGRDEKATVIYGESEEDAMTRRRSLNKLISEWREAGVYDEDLIQQFMLHVVDCEPDTERFQISLGGGEWYALDDEGRAIDDADMEADEELSEDTDAVEDATEDSTETEGDEELTEETEDTIDIPDELVLAYAENPDAVMAAIGSINDAPDEEDAPQEYAEQLASLIERFNELAERVALCEPLIEMFGLEADHEETTDVELSEDDGGEPDGEGLSAYELIEALSAPTE